MEEVKERIKEEIRKNFQFFIQQTFDQNDIGKFAIIKDAHIINILDTRRDAKKIADEKYKDGIYSIQQIQPPQKDLGFVSHALRKDLARL